MTLPNLNTLMIDSMKIAITSEATKLKKLVISDNFQWLVFDKLVRSLAFMPVLSSLMLKVGPAMSKTAIHAIVKAVHSRDQNIVLFSIRKHSIRKMAEIPCQTTSSQEKFGMFLMEDEI